MTEFASATAFIDIIVTVKHSTIPGKYDVHTEPPAPIVTETDTVINYHIFDPEGNNIVFSGMSVKPHDNNQLSAPSVSVSGQLLTFSDANTKKMTLDINLKFKDKLGLEFMHDPQVKNEPQPAR